ncbi:F-box/LRR-repeat protein At3g48880-like [Zingiber officinale]|uniref:F-box/LRR-repeat protein At3g48880-like n=1 Tax=Zingiber officinale TaxID=94328 RepID=UPI001C4B3D31|nr:F-box/LRR-repeat protein At3g48880-like [Zingiber officinale]
MPMFSSGKLPKMSTVMPIDTPKPWWKLLASFWNYFVPNFFHMNTFMSSDLAVAVPFVCKSWYRASLDPSCWRRLNFRSLDFTPWSPFSRAFALRYCLHSPLSFSAFLRFALHCSRGVVDQLAFPLSSAVSIHDLAYASVKCLRLKALALPDNLMLEDDLRISELVRRWKDLEHLEMEIVGIFAPPILSFSRSCNLSFAIPISLPKPLSFATSSLPRLHSPPSRNPGPFRAQVSVSAAQKTKDRLPANLIVTETKGPHSIVCTFPFSTF